jgi:hypothetical protein
MSGVTVQEIQAFVAGEGQLPRERFERWARSDDPADLEAAIDAVTLANERIVPPVDEWGYFELLLQAMKVSLKRRGDATELSPYLLAGDLLSFLDDAKERLGSDGFDRVASRLEQELRGLVQNLSPLDERALVDGFLEHFLERDDLRSVFESWRAEPTLARLYLEADEWASSARQPS